MRARILTTVLLTLAACVLHAREVRVSDAVFGTPPGFRAQPAIQRGGDGYLVAWVDGRIGYEMVFAARLNDAGEAIDRSGFPLGDTHYYRDARPQIIWNGEAWLVFFSSRGRLLMVRVAPDGTRSEPRLILEQARPDPRGRSIATNGKIIVVTYTVELYVPGTHVVVLSMNGDRISDREVDSHAATTGMVVERDGEFVIAWNNFAAGQGELFAIRLDGSGGRFLDAAPRLLGKSPNQIELTRNGNGYLVLEQHWGADRWEFTSHAVSADLATATSPGYVQISDTRRAFVQDGASAVLIAADGPKFQALRFDDAGHAISRDEILQSTLPLGDVAMTRIASGFAASWIVLENESVPRLVTAKLDPAFVPATPPRAVSETAAPQSAPEIAAGASEMLVAWVETFGLHLAQFGYDGARIGEEIVLDDVNTGYRPPVSMLFDGERYVIAYKRALGFAQRQEVVVRFLTPRGGLLPDIVVLPTTYETGEITLAKGRSSTIVLWRRNEGVLAAAIEGTQLRLQPRVIASGTVSSRIAAAWNGESFLVAWAEGFLDWDVYLYNRVVGALVDEDLTLRSPRHVLAPVGPLRSPSISLVSRMLAFDNGANVSLAPIDHNGNAGPVRFVEGTVSRLASEGDQVLLAWNDSQSLRVAPLSADGSLKNEGFRIPTLSSASLARKGNLTIAGYSRFVPEAGDMPRAFLSLTGDTPNPGRRRSAR
ncbi:MAG TPA: hypothetical protein VKB93_17830 [Thermoanaerobaculia bacterium]|nr:hypothetical protein [Thermoanaerobaculia bacterium]